MQLLGFVSEPKIVLPDRESLIPNLFWLYKWFNSAVVVHNYIIIHDDNFLKNISGFSETWQHLKKNQKNPPSDIAVAPTTDRIACSAWIMWRSLFLTEKSILEIEANRNFFSLKGKIDRCGFSASQCIDTVLNVEWIANLLLGQADHFQWGNIDKQNPMEIKCCRCKEKTD